MLIGELSERSGLSRDTIRFYEKVGLIRLRRSDRRRNNYKEYSEDILSRLLMTVRLKEFGFTLKEIQDILDILEAGFSPCQDMPELLTDRIRDLENKIANLILFRDRLVQAKASCNGSCQEVFSEEGCLSL